MSAWRIIEGDCLTALRGMDDCSVDAVATDPPYSLAFMGSKWDSHPSPAAFQAWCQEWAAECLRVLKPGGHLVAFGGTRTYHRLTSGIEDAGFEIRDCLAWLYGSGFPKSHNIGNGRGTALKPAWESVVLARKPLTGTVAANVEAHGTGALNIDGCRIPANGKTPFPVGDYGDRGIYGADGERADDPNPSGRWPANVCLDEEAAPRAMTARVPGAPGRPAWPRPFRTRGPTSMLARMANKAPLETDDAIVLVLGAPGGNEKAGWLEGVTRLEKLIFLLERETPVRDWMTEKADFHSWRFGPFSSKVYEAADTLAAAKLIRDSASIAHNAEDRWESLNALMDEQDVDPYTTRTFQLTDRGRRYYEAVLRDLPPNAEEILADFKRKFARLPLRQLVRYVYERYPQFTDESEMIRDQILR